MKSLLSNLLCASLLFFAVGCGKDGGGSSKSGSNNLTAPHQSMQAVITNLNSWYNGTSEGSRALGRVKIKKVKSNISSNQNCGELDVKLFKLPYCFNAQYGNTTSGTTVSETEKDLVQDGAVISARENPELRAIFNIPQERIVNASFISYDQTIIRIDVLENNTIITYVIDKNYHSLLNPMQKMVNSQSLPEIINTKAECVLQGIPLNLPGGCRIY